MRVFLSAGEPSGDHHAALVVEAIRRRDPEAEFVGLGGPRMEAAGCRLLADLTRLAVMWFLRAMVSIHRFVDLARRAERSFLDARPDVCVLVDFPGFHWWLAWRARRHGIPVVFYCPPQIWAWASWRRHKMRRLVDHVLAPLPFEHHWFVAQGIPATFVGHPFFDEAGHGAVAGADPRPDAATAAPPRTAEAGPLVLLLPGSRSQEIAANLPSLLRTASAIRRRVPAARFTVAVLHERHAATARRMAAFEPGAPVEIVAGRARELMDGAACAVAVSGSVSLELLSARLPAVIVYRISGLAWVVQSWFRHARFITLVNLLATAEPIGPVRPAFLPPRDVPAADPEAVYPEYLAVGDPAERAAGHVVEWLTDREALAKIRRRVAEVAAAIDRPGSADRAAAAVLAIARGGDPAAAVRGAAGAGDAARAA